MRCKYCYVYKENENFSLTQKQLFKAIDIFFNYPFKREAIAFLGGEPFLYFNKIIETIKYIRKYKDKDIKLMIYTNGTLINERKLKLLQNYNVKINLSIDGDSKTNDLNRKLLNSQKSAFEMVYKKILKIREENFEKIQLNPVFNTKTISYLVKNIDFFNRIGFKNILPDQQLWELWHKSDLEQLKIFFMELYEYLKRNNNIYLPIIDEIKEKHNSITPKDKFWWDSCDNIVLGPDGNFYICEYVLGGSLSKAKEYVIGSIKTGINFNRINSLISEAKDTVIKNLNNKEDINYFWFCPMGMYFEYKIKKKQGFKKNLNNYNVFSKHFMNLLLWLSMKLKRER